jgi:hypothetical protein
LEQVAGKAEEVNFSYQLENVRARSSSPISKEISTLRIFRHLPIPTKRNDKLKTIF